MWAQSSEWLWLSRCKHSSVGTWLRGWWSWGLLCMKGVCRIRAVGMVAEGSHGVYFSSGHGKIHKIQRSPGLWESLLCGAPWLQHAGIQSRSRFPFWPSASKMRLPALRRMSKTVLKGGTCRAQGSQLPCVTAKPPKAADSVWCTCEEISQTYFGLGISFSTFPGGMASAELLLVVKMLHPRKCWSQKLIPASYGPLWSMSSSLSLKFFYWNYWKHNDANIVFLKILTIETIICILKS